MSKFTLSLDQMTQLFCMPTCKDTSINGLFRQYKKFNRSNSTSIFIFVKLHVATKIAFLSWDAVFGVYPVVQMFIVLLNRSEVFS